MQCVVIYGLTKCAGQAAANDALFAEAVSWVQAYSGFSILVGDFNMPPCRPCFKGALLTSSSTISQQVVSLSPTCDEATHNDTMLFPSQMLSCIQRVQTRTDFRLSIHAHPRLTILYGACLVCPCHGPSLVLCISKMPISYFSTSPFRILHWLLWMCGDCGLNV